MLVRQGAWFQTQVTPVSCSEEDHLVSLSGNVAMLPLRNVLNRVPTMVCYQGVSSVAMLLGMVAMLLVDPRARQGPPMLSGQPGGGIKMYSLASRPTSRGVVVLVILGLPLVSLWAEPQKPTAKQAAPKTPANSTPAPDLDEPPLNFDTRPV